MKRDLLNVGATSLLAQHMALTVTCETELSTVYLYGAGTVSGGTVVVEEAHDETYAGTWSVIQSVTASTLNGAGLAIHIGGYVAALRVRVSSAITGGGSIGVKVGGV